MSSQALSKRAGLIVIGDEILKGQIKDTNSQYLTQHLHQKGIRVARISVLPDDIDVIAAEVKTFTKTFDYVLTSGGIGPTHDDVTFEAVAQAFDCKCEHHPQLVKMCEAWFKKVDRSDPCFKLAFIPSKSELNFGLDRKSGKMMMYPIVSVSNVFIFPGVPELLRRAFENLQETLFPSQAGFHNREYYFESDEISLTTKLNQLVESHQRVTFGSYPAWSNQYYRTKITLESSGPEFLDDAVRNMKELLSPVSFDPNTTENTYQKIQNLLTDCDDEKFCEVVRTALETMEECYRKFPPGSVSVCFNGGKDCVVMLHIAHAVHQNLFQQKKMKSFYVKEEETFAEVENFMSDTIERYSLDNKVYQQPIKAALSQMLAADPEVKATVLGVRKGDPGADRMNYFSPTDGDWPAVMRVNPVLNWDYRHVWRFIRSLSLPYPSLYDQGYTSLGRPDNTQPNPALAYTNSAGETLYRPAYSLQDPSLEREGRR